MRASTRNTLWFLRYWLPVALLMGFILMSTDAGSAARTNPIIAGFIIEFLPALARRLRPEGLGAIGFIARKTAHVIEYSLLGFLLYRAFRAGRRGVSLRDALFTQCLGTCYAITDETHQVFVPGRWATPMDVLYDSCGVFLGLCVCAYLSRMPPKSRNTPSYPS